MDKVVGYEAPSIEIIEVEVEIGFAGSARTAVEVNDWGTGTSIN